MKPEADCTVPERDPLELPDMHRDEKPLMSSPKMNVVKPWIAAFCSMAALAALIIVPLFHSAESRVCALAETALVAVMPSAVPSASNPEQLAATVSSLQQQWEFAANKADNERAAIALAAVYLRLHRKVDARKVLETVEEGDSLSPSVRSVIVSVIPQLR